MAIVCGCGRKVDTQPEWAGQWITCPGCAGSLYSPFPGPKPSAPTVPSAADFEEFPVVPAAAPTRLCPVCAETIPVADPTCKFCGGAPAARPPARPAPAAAPAAARPTDNGGMAALIVSLIGYMFCACLLCPVGWIIGANYEADCRRRGVEPSGAGKAGKIIGLVGTIFLGLGACWFILSLVLG
jgi:hypothetical protein